MALTRKLLKSMGIDDDKIDEIITAHAETVEALKNERDTANGKLAELASVTAERDKLTKRVESLEANGTDAAKVQAAFDAYKAQVEKQQTDKVKSDLIDSVLREIGIGNEAARKLVLKGYDLDSIEVDEAGKLKDADGVKTALSTEYGSLVSTVSTAGTNPINPASGGSGARMTKNEIMAIKDTAERQKAIAENPEVFGYKPND